MKKTICFYFQVHQPYRLRQYRFFDIGKSDYYFDDFANRNFLERIAERCYLPMNRLMLDLITSHKGAFKVAFSISGIALQQFEENSPQVLKSFQALAQTGNVEFLAETYAHSLASLVSEEEFRSQVLHHAHTVERLFGVQPVTFRNTELIYSDAIGATVADMGYQTMLAEGAKHILGWKSPHYLYTNPVNPKLKLLLRNFNLSDDIAFRFSNREWERWPLTADKFVGWLSAIDKEDEIVNLFMDYETFGEHQSISTGIFEFMRHLPGAILKQGDFELLTPAEAAVKHQPISMLHTPFATSWADEERDVSAWIGNELQNEAITKLYALEEAVKEVNDPQLFSRFRYLQASDHFYYMCTKFFSDGAVHKYFNPYNTPYEAFINYMNVISDFQIRLDKTNK
ncbi:MAG: glycoside hydrolase family 57 protein [Prevotellaceae bacterium]|jgi:alpha-amylase|nr:glycoside hydrolase family 57 protein [Prevotellaceae bacterium]